MDDFLTRREHEEFSLRIAEENKRQDARIGELENTVKEIGRLTVSVEKMATSMENMTKEQAKLGAKLDEIEKRPAKHWEAVVTGIIAAIVGALGAAIMSGIIH